MPETAPGATGIPGPGLRRGQVLVVDDEPLIGSSARRLLAREHDVVVVQSGDAALEAIASGPTFEAILCDLMMPGMNGMELYRALAASHPALTERIIFMTGGAFTVAAEAFLDTVARRRLDKPFDPATLKLLVRELVGS